MIDGSVSVALEIEYSVGHVDRISLNPSQPVNGIDIRFTPIDRHLYCQAF